MIRAIKDAMMTKKHHLVILLLGFASGLPAALTASTLQAWFTEAGIHLKTIGAVTLLVLPYSLRFIWAPLFDHLWIPGLDRRRGWLLITQIGLILSIASMAFLVPHQVLTIPLGAVQRGIGEALGLQDWMTSSGATTTLTVPWLIICGFITAILSASQDIVINAYQIEMLPQAERALGASVSVAGWRVGAIISGGMALVWAQHRGWEQTYLLMASFMLIGVLTTLIAPPLPLSSVNIPPPMSFWHAAMIPIKDFFQRYGMTTAVGLLFVIITYKVGEALALALNTTFLLRHMGFDLTTLGFLNKTVSMLSALLGGLVAGTLMLRLSLYRALLLFGLIQAVANLSYVLIACVGKSTALLVGVAFAENFCSSMGNIALLAFIMALCNVKYTATQLAFFMALAFFARTWVGPLAAVLVEQLGWSLFFFACFILSLPTLVGIYVTRKVIQQLAT